jgi:hypothetical protein
VQVFDFGTVIADLSADSAGGQGAVTANLKLTNAIKVPCNVACSVEPAGKSAAAEPLSISVKPAQLMIPAHECRFVQLVFHPKLIASVSGVFKAVVENGQGNPATHQFTCKVQVRFRLLTVYLTRFKVGPQRIVDAYVHVPPGVQRC